MKSIKAWMLLIFLIITQSVFSQEIPLAGVVYDAQKQPLQGVEVLLTPGNQLKITDKNGSFTFSRLEKQNYRLDFTFLGYQPQSILIKKDIQKKIAVYLQEEVQTLSEIVVKDDYAEQKRRESMLNVDVVDEEYLQRSMGGSLVHSLEQLPGVSVMNIGSGQAKPVLRGLSFNRVVVVQNGIKHEAQQWGADHGLEIDQFATGRIEVIRGPASLLYGSDAIGGVIDILPRSLPAKNSLQGEAFVTAKSNNDLIGSSVNFNGRKEKLFFNVQTTYITNGDMRVPTDFVNIYSYKVTLPDRRMRNTAGKELGVNANIGYVNNRVKTVFNISNFYQKSGFFANAHGLEPKKVDEKLHDKSSRDILFPYHKVNHIKLMNNTVFFWNNNQLKIDVGYQKNYRTERNDYVAHGFMPDSIDANIDLDPELERKFVKNTYSFKSIYKRSTEQHTLQAGVDMEYQQNEVGGTSFIIPAFKRFVGGAFIYDQWKINDILQLHTGLRFDVGDLKTSRYKDWFLSEDEATKEKEYLTRSGNMGRTFKNVSWSVGLNADLAPFQLKMNIGKSFRVPIAKELSSNGVNYHHFSYEVGNAALDAEVAYQWDAGIEVNQSNWAIHISPYVSYFPNYIYLNPTSPHDYLHGAGNQIFEYEQSKVFRYGGEIHMHHQPLSWMKLGMVGEYVYAEQLSGEKEGYTLPFSPPANLLFKLNFLPKESRLIKTPYVGVDYKIVAKQSSVVPPEEPTDGYSLVNLHGGATFAMLNQPIEVKMMVENLLNTRYLNHTSFYRLIGLPEPGRNISLTIKIPF